MRTTILAAVAAITFAAWPAHAQTCPITPCVINHTCSCTSPTPCATCGGGGGSCRGKPTPQAVVLQFNLPIGGTGQYELGYGDQTYPYGLCAGAYFCHPVEKLTYDVYNFQVLNEAGKWYLQYQDIAAFGCGVGGECGASVQVECIPEPLGSPSLPSYIQEVTATASPGSDAVVCAQITNNINAYPFLMGDSGAMQLGQTAVALQWDGTWWSACARSYAGSTITAVAYGGALDFTVPESFTTLYQASSTSDLELDGTTMPSQGCGIFTDASPFFQIDYSQHFPLLKQEPTGPYVVWGACMK